MKSIFFLTGNAVAGSHAPLTVATFATALSILYLATATQPATWRFPAGRALAGAWTALIGVVIAGGWLTTARAIILR